MSTPESKVKKAVKAMLKDHGIYFFMPTTGGYGRSGVPDIIACYEGQFLAIECKAGKNEPTALQKREMQKIQDSGGMVMVVNENNLDTFNSWLWKMMGITPTTDSGPEQW